jgi:colanic acid/amylovoran biosynthesis protein
MNVMVICHDAANKGDRAVLLFVLRELARNGVDQIAVVATSPGLWRDCGDIAGTNVQFLCQPWYLRTDRPPGIFRRFVRRLRLEFYRRVVYAIVRRAFLGGCGARLCDLLAGFFNRPFLETAREADFILCTGGHHLTTILKEDAVCSQTYDMSLALLSGKPLVLWAQSIGPFQFQRKKNADQIRKIIAKASRIYLRGKASVPDVAARGAASDSVFLTRDSGFGLRALMDAPSRVPPSQREPILGVTVYHATIVDRDAYIEALATLATHAVERGYRIRLFPMEMGGGDADLLRAIVERSGRPDACAIQDARQPTSEQLRAIAECRVFVGHKTHSVVFALSAAVPIVAIAYHRKTRDFMEQFGLGEYCLDDADLTSTRLIERFDALEADADAIHQRQLFASVDADRRVRNDFADMIAHMKQLQQRPR